MDIELLRTSEVDRLLSWPFGKTSRLARDGKIPCVQLPDGQIRIAKTDLQELLISRRLETPHA